MKIPSRSTATALALVLASGLAWAAGRDGTRGVRVKAQPAVGGPGTVAYDPGPPQDFFRGFDGVNRTIGNQFDTRNGNPLMPGTISAVTVFPVAVGEDAILTVFGPPMGTVAPILGIVYPSGMVDSTFNMVPFTLPVGSSFLVGMYVGTFGSGPDSVGMRSATTGGQGFHGMQINFVDLTSGTGFQTLSGQNAMVRVTGTVVPVELQAFDVE